MFKEIFSRYDTDKVNTFYESAYDDLFTNRNEVKLLFEIGVYHGGSLRGWRDYFPNARVVGLDVNPVCRFTEERISVEIGDATQKVFVDSLLAKYGEPDVVIDDGSHMSRDIKLTFELLYERTKKFYVIEDLGTQYQEFQNGSFLNDGVSATKVIYQKIDELLYSKVSSIRTIKICHSICMIQKR